jgi:hypothetical protein
VAKRQDERVRVGTWNLDGRWNANHVELLLAQECDVWLLTEIREHARLPGFESYLTTGMMGPRKHWAGIFSQFTIQPLADPDVASAIGVGAGIIWCSSILPWRSCGSEAWGAGSTSEKVVRALDHLMGAVPDGRLVWGGDWNHAMTGKDRVGTHAGRIAIEHALTRWQLQLTTRQAPHRVPGQASIDHIAVPRAAHTAPAVRVVAEGDDGIRLSDHDLYTTQMGCC